MVRRLTQLFTIILLLSNTLIFPQEKEQIEQKRSELSSIKSQIDNLQDQLITKTQKEKKSFAVLNNYNKQIYLLNKVINKLHAEEKQKQKQINSNEKRISVLIKDIKDLQNNYSKYVVAVYKHGKVSELESLLDAESVEQAILRVKYLQKFTEKRKQDLAELKNKKNELILARERLNKQKKKKALLAAQKEDEENNLQSKIRKSKRIIAAIKHDKTELKKELEAKRSAETDIKSMITKLIAEAEQKRRAEEERLAKGKLNEELNTGSKTPARIKEESTQSSSNYDINLSTENFSSFAALKGKLNWPVNHGRIIKKFGKNRNSHLNTVTVNYGVDIKTSSDEVVKAVAEGVVSTINWIPGYGSVVIVTHKGDYRTVYSHLSEIDVEEGDRVKLGSLIGRVGESLEGNVLHFEIWNSRKNQNPEVWLARK